MGKAKAIKQKVITVKINEIQTTLFSLKEPTKKFDQSNSQAVNYTVSPIIKYNFTDDIVLIVLNVDAIINETQEVILNISTNFFFKVENLKGFVTPKKGNPKEFDASKGMLTMLMQISIGTMRGIIMERCSQSILRIQFMPIMDTNTFFKPPLKKQAVKAKVNKAVKKKVKNKK